LVSPDAASVYSTRADAANRLLSFPATLPAHLLPTLSTPPALK
jgi:hypothetical protein